MNINEFKKPEGIKSYADCYAEAMENYKKYYRKLRISKDGVEDLDCDGNPIPPEPDVVINDNK